MIVGDRVRWEAGGALFGGGVGWKGLVCEGRGSFRVRWGTSCYLFGVFRMLQGCWHGIACWAASSFAFPPTFLDRSGII